MDLNRQRSRTRGNSRANTLPSLSSATVDTETTATMTVDTSFLPSIEESLQDWLTRSIPDTPSSSSVSWLLDVCRCCNNPNCENLEALSSKIRKLESDARLAAEIGQSLLHKHEQYVNESNEIKNGLEQELDQVRDKVRELEQNLIDSDNIKQDLTSENKKTFWEYQKAKKALEETTADLVVSNNRCLQLGSELKSKLNEVEKLRVFKFMARQADIREDTLRAKLEDIKQELAISRKAELTLESKHKKLKAKYETIYVAFEKLKLDQQELGLTKDHQLDLVWLRESNEKLRKDVLKLTSALLSPSYNHTNNNVAAADLHMTNNSPPSITNNHHLIELIKELASANNKLKSDLLDCSDLLMECRNELYAKLNNSEETGEVEDSMHNDDNGNIAYGGGRRSSGTSVYKKRSSYTGDCNDNKESPAQQQLQQDEDTNLPVPQLDEESIASVPKLRRTASKRSNYVLPSSNNQPEITDMKQKKEDESGKTEKPVVHHHYHYYMKNKLADGKDKKKSPEVIKQDESLLLAPPSTLSSSLSTKPIRVDSSSPFRQLYNQVTTVLQRLQQTDIRALNRRLRRAFDILELSSMSNSIIESIIVDVDGLTSRFVWIEDQAIIKKETWIHDISMIEFFPIINLVQEMLKEIGQLRTTMNELQVEYFKKVEESDQKLEEELLRKQQQKSILPVATTTAQTPITFSRWISNVFQLKKEKEGLLHIHGNGDMNGCSNNNNSAVVHPLAQPKMIPSTSESTMHHHDSSNQKIPISRSATVSHSRKRNEPAIVDSKFGPPSSFPTRSSFSSMPSSLHHIAEKKRKQTVVASTGTLSCSPSSSSSHDKPPQPFITIRASQSTGTVRRSKSMQAPALEYVVRRKRSTLGLSSSTSTDYDCVSSQPNSPDNMTGTFATSWLANK